MERTDTNWILESAKGRRHAERTSLRVKSQVVDILNEAMPSNNQVTILLAISDLEELAIKIDACAHDTEQALYEDEDTLFAHLSGEVLGLTTETIELTILLNRVDMMTYGVWAENVRFWQDVLRAKLKEAKP